MKQITLACLFLLPITLLAQQAPQSFKYQAILRNADGSEQPNTNVQVVFRIFQGSPGGAPIYCEEHSAETNGFGLFNLNVGQGSSNLGCPLDFSAIDWGSAPHYLQVEVDGEPFGAPVQLLSVPYALYGKDEDADPKNEIQTLSKIGNTVTLSDDGGSFIDEVDDGDNDDQNELQDWSTLPGIPAGFADGTDNVNDDDDDPDNETISSVILNGTVLEITEAGTTTSTDLSSIADDGDWVLDGDNLINGNNGNIGIGTTTPNSQLHIVGPEIDDATSTAPLEIISGTERLLIDGNQIESTVDPLVLNNDSPLDVLITPGIGKVGIGVTGSEVLSEKLTVLGRSPLGQLTVKASTSFPDYKLAGINYRIDNSNVWQTFVENPSNSFFLRYNGDDDKRYFTLTTQGNVGIGTDNPTEKLQVDNGMIQVTPDPDEPFGPVMRFVTPEGDSAQVKIFRGTDGRLYQDFDVLTSTDDQETRYSFFRHTNTTGIKAVNFMRGNGSDIASAHIGVDGESSFFQRHGGDFLIGDKGNLETNLVVYGSAVIRNETVQDSRSFTLRTNTDSDLEFVGNGTTVMTITDNEFGGNDFSVGIGTTTPGEKLHVVGNARVTGNLILGGSCTGCSDKRFKCKLEPLAGTLQKLSQLNAIYYFWDTEAFPDRKFSEDRQIGIIAQDLEKVYPELVFTDAEGYKSVAYGRLTPVLLSAIQEQQQQIEAQQAEIERLKADNEAMLNRLDRIEAWIGQQETTAGK